MTVPVVGTPDGTPPVVTPEVTPDAAPEAIVPPAANNWWQFTDKDAAEAWANNLVTNRLARQKTVKIDPLQQSHDTLEAEVQRLKPFEEAALSEGERRERTDAANKAELDRLLAFEASTKRTETIRGIADEISLPASLVKFVVGNDDAELRESAQTLLDALSEGGATPKKTPPAKAPKTDPTPGGSVSPGGGGSDEESDDALTQSILDEIKLNRSRGGLSIRH